MRGSGKKHGRCSLDFPNGRARIRWRVGGGKRLSARLAYSEAQREDAENARLMFEKAVAAGRDPRELYVGIIPGIVLPDARLVAVEPEVAVTTPEVSELLPETPELTIGMVFEPWMARMSNRHMTRKAQQRDYRRHVSKVLDIEVGSRLVRDLPVRDFTAGILVELRQILLDRGRDDGGPASRGYVQNILSASFRAFVRDALLEHIPADPFTSPEWRRWPRRRPIDEREPPNPFFPEQRDRILEWFARQTFRVNNKPREMPSYLGWIAVQCLAGLSPSEASGLRCGDIVLDRAFLWVRTSYNLGELDTTKNTRRRRSVELDDRLVGILSRVLPEEDGGDAPAFPNSRGRPIEPTSFDPILRRCQEELGIPKRGAYCLKDTCVSLCLMAGASEDWIQRQTGVRIETLREHYAKWYPEAARQQLEKIRAFENQFASAMGGSAGGSGHGTSSKVQEPRNEQDQ